MGLSLHEARGSHGCSQLTLVSQEAGTDVKAGSCGLCCTLILVQLLFALDVQFRVGRGRVCAGCRPYDHGHAETWQVKYLCAAL